MAAHNSSLKSRHPTSSFRWRDRPGGILFVVEALITFKPSFSHADGNISQRERAAFLTSPLHNEHICARDHFCSAVEYKRPLIIQTSGAKPELLLLHQP